MNQKVIDIRKRTEERLDDYVELKNRTLKIVTWENILEYKNMAVCLGAVMDEVENIVYSHGDELCIDDMFSLFTSYVDLAQAQKAMSVMYEHWIHDD